MKPIKLTISAFGPYSDQVVIDFNKLGECGLFLVTGDTGAGKTTIFDAICFALFGEMSGVYREGSMMRSDFAKAETKTFVSLEFLYKDKKYCVERNPAYERPKLRSEGFTKELPGATLNLPDGRVVSSFGTVTSEIEKILGINKNQFSQIAMIAQGDFLRLLLADNKDRSAIFRKVFSTDLYERFQVALKTQSNQMKAEYEALSRQIVQIFSDVVCADEDPNFERLITLKNNKSMHDYAEIMVLLSALISDDQKRLSSENERIESLQRDMERLLLEINKANQDNQKLEAFNKIEQVFTALTDQSEVFKLKANQVIEAEKALYFVKPVEERLYAAQEKVKDTHLRIEQYDASIKRLTIESEEHAKQFQEAKAKEPDRVKLSSEIALIEDALPMYRELDALDAKVYTHTKAVEAKTTLVTSLQTEKVALDNKIGVLQSEIEGLLEAENSINETSSKHERAKNTHERLIRLNSKNDKLNATKMELEEAVLRFQDYNQAYVTKRDSYHTLEQLFFSEQASILAEQLVDHSPCPVCGATEHPRPSQKSENAPTKEALDALKRDVELASNQTNEGSIKVGALQQSIADMQSDFLTEAEPFLGKGSLEALVPKLMTEINLIAGQVEALNAEHLIKIKQVEALKSNRALLANISKDLQLHLDAIKEAEEALTQLRIAMTEDASQAKTIRARLKYRDFSEATMIHKQKMQAFEALKKELEMAEERYQASKKALDQAKAAFEELNLSLGIESQACDTLVKQFDEAIKMQHFSDVNHYHSKLLKEETIRLIKLEVERFGEQMTSVTAEKNRLQIETEGLRYRDTSALEASRKLSETEKVDAEQRKMVVYSRIEHNMKINENLKKTKGEIEGLERHYLTIKNLSDTANGDLQGKQRLAFERYIQAFYFNRVLMEANKRFSYMTNKRFELVRKDEASDMRSHSGLEIDVMDHYTGKTRSVKSLSGGESFKASLALALGLSDMIQTHAGGVQMDTMFVDEGFGALDSESLEQAIDVLNALTHGNRLVGIISHVSELREKIDRKIVVKKGNTGSYVELV